VSLINLRLRGVRKTGIDLAAFAQEMDGFTFADGERVCFEASKAMVLKGQEDLTAEILRAELAEQRARMAYTSFRKG
jgi:hypothetical protein